MFKIILTPFNRICNFLFLKKKTAENDKRAEIPKNNKVSQLSSGWIHSFANFHKSATQVDIPETKPAKNK